MQPIRTDIPTRRRPVRWSRVMYLIDSLRRYPSDRSCPSCGGQSAGLVERKYGVTRLFRCPDCHLQFRHPKATTGDSVGFYQEAYAQDDGITTDLPDAGGLQRLRDAGFGEKNADRYIELFAQMHPGRPQAAVRIIDYGCSWGYQSLQFRDHGYAVSGLEVSRPRADFGRERLGLDIVTDDAELIPGADIFFSSHVIEHLPDPGQLVRTGLRLLRSGGYLVVECPNGSEARRRREPAMTRKAWGRVHPNLISAEFLAYVFREHPFLIVSSPLSDLSSRYGLWDGQSQRVEDLGGPNLLVIAKKD